MTRTLPLALVALGMLALPFTLACAGPSPLGGPAPVASSTGGLLVSNGSQSGEMGEIVDFSGRATRHSGDYYGTGASVRIDSEGSDWWVMSRLDISGDLAGVAFAPGTHRTYASGVSDDPTGIGTYVTVTGCSGPSYGNYTFDTQASTVEITVSEAGASQRRVDYVTTYSGQITRGSFVYRVPSSSGTTTIDGRGI